MPLKVFSPGEIAEFEYPANNILGCPLEYVRRRVRVESVRDCSTAPVPADWLLKFPLTRRGSIIMFAHDLDLDDRRAFYLEAIRGGRRPHDLPSVRLGLYDCDSPDDMVDWLGVYRPTVRDRLLMRDAIEVFQEKLLVVPNLTLAAFPVME